MTVPAPALPQSQSYAAGSVSYVLVVDDDPAIRTEYDAILSARGYEVATARTRADALEQVERLEGLVDVILMEISLPDGDGAELAREIIERIGLRPVVYMSGWAEEFWNLSDAPGRWLVMQKPISVPQLLAAVEFVSGRSTARPT